MRCYAERFAALRLSGPGRPYEGLARRSASTGEPRWTGEVRFVEELLPVPLRWKRPRRIFVNSMSDLFHEKLDDQVIDKIFAIMAMSRHTFQVLTKRPARMLTYMRNRDWSDVANWAVDRYERRLESPLFFAGEVVPPLPNIWLGVSAENQETADERIPLLLRTPAAVRFVSAEPLLGPIDFTRIGRDGPHDLSALEHVVGLGYERPPLDWIIAGGESGPGFRAVELEWLLSIRDQCAHAGTPFFFKQWGGLFPKSNGRTLEGRTWNEFPLTEVTA